jgi:hypothetical protein
VLHSYFKNVRFFYTMSRRLSVEDGKSSLQQAVDASHLSEFSMIDGELAIILNGEIEHVFERDSLSKAAYTYMIRWIQDKKSPDDDPGTAWLEAEQAWDILSPEIQGMLVSIANKERQQACDIRDGLLATLHGYNGLKTIKDAYAECIRGCFGQWEN